MLYAIVGTQSGVRSKAHAELSKLGQVTESIYSEQVSELKRYIDASSLFGEKIIVSCVQLSGTASSKEALYDLLSEMQASSNIFIVDEPFADVHVINKLTKFSKKVFNGKEEKIKDTSVFTLCDSFAKKDKKQAWLDFMAIRDKGEAEAIQGALWWKFQLVWQGVKEGRRSAFTEEECARIGGDLVKASILAHRGKKDLMMELERIILSL